MSKTSRMSKSELRQLAKEAKQRGLQALRESRVAAAKAGITQKDVEEEIRLFREGR